MLKENESTKRFDDIVLIAAGFVGCEDYVAKAFDVKYITLFDMMRQLGISL